MRHWPPQATPSMLTQGVQDGCKRRSTKNSITQRSAGTRKALLRLRPRGMCLICFARGPKRH
eukprot:3184178-Alexandrium_andersonii.AAC.1